MTTLSNTVGQVVPVYTTDGRLIWGGEDRPDPVPPVGPDRNVATLCSVATAPASISGAVGRMAAHRQTLVVDAIRPRLAWVIQGGFGGNTPTPYTMRAAIAPRGGAPIPVTFDGEHEVSIPGTPTITITSDPAPISALAGDVVDVYVWASNDHQADLTGFLPGRDIGVSDGTYSQALTSLAPIGEARGTIRPARIIAPSDRPAWILAGDSIAQQGNSFLDRAAAVRGLAAVKSAMGGDGYQYYPGRWESMYGRHTGHADHMIDQYGANSPNAVQALAFWQHAKANGVSYLAKTTVAPRVRPDGTPPEADLAFNAWLRDGAPLTPDLSAPAEVGTPGAPRAAVIQQDGAIIGGAGGHPVYVISDAAAAVEDPDRPGHYTQAAADAMADWTDWLHYNGAVHQMVADRLARDLELLGF